MEPPALAIGSQEPLGRSLHGPAQAGELKPDDLQRFFPTSIIL